jgi:DUF4097 and DUF4098 domain-containing protein YvlB
VIHVPHRRGLLSVALGRDPDVVVRVRCPRGAALRARTRAADVVARGTLGAVELKTASGDARLDEVDGRLEAVSASGDVRAGHVHGPASVKTASGDARLDRVDGRLEASLVSGDLEAGDLRAGAAVNTVSGGVTLAAVLAGPVDVRTVSGDVRVGIRRGSTLWVDATSVSGSMSSEMPVEDRPPEGQDAPLVELRGRTVSGDIRLIRAPALDPAAAGASA